MGDARDNNVVDRELLRTNPNALIVRHQKTVEIIVGVYTAKGLFDPSEFQDTVQSVNEALLRRIPRMQKQFRGESLFRTYLSRVVTNVCLSLHQRTKRHPKTREIREDDSYAFEDTPETELIRQEVEKLRLVLQLYGKRLPEISLCLRMYYRLPFVAEDLNRWLSKPDGNALLPIVERYNRLRDGFNNKEVYALLTPILNKIEGKTSSPDARRKWVDSKLAEIARLMRGKSSNIPYDKRLLKLLVEEYFSPFLDKN